MHHLATIHNVTDRQTTDDRRRTQHCCISLLWTHVPGPAKPPWHRYPI